jgi:hypothetical protein
MDIWKSLITPLIVAAISAAAFVFERATAPDTAGIDAQIKWWTYQILYMALVH